MPIRTLSDFAGAWTLRRFITHASGATAEFRGTATWRAQEGMLRCDEVGLIKVGTAAAVNARQTYLWDKDLRVHFADGRFFHKVPPGGGDAGHWCDPDQYDGAYDFADWPAWTVTWTVLGPRKDYHMRSAYSRTEATAQGYDGSARH